MFQEADRRSYHFPLRPSNPVDHQLGQTLCHSSESIMIDWCNMFGDRNALDQCKERRVEHPAVVYLGPVDYVGGDGTESCGTG